MKAKPFQFKRFSIFQDQCAMKVGTDGVLLGAWVEPESATNILDIGSGTGLISLMLAQRSNAKIIGIEIDQKASNQSIQNVINSPWKDRLSIQTISLQDFAKGSNQKFDLIVSNPPFFEAQKKITQRSVARSQQTLELEELMEQSAKLLSEKGKIAFVFPSSKEEELIRLAKSYQLYPTKICYVKGNLISPVKRILIEFSFNAKKVNYSTITIEKEKRQDYTEEYRNLLKDYLIIF